jgi:hypothetical protein
MGNELKYEMLTAKEQLRYAEIMNKIDTDWGVKADDAERKSKSFWHCLATGGLSVVLYLGKASYHSSKFLFLDSPRVSKFIDGMRKKYKCEDINKASFPFSGNW